jgi:CheY-like chemotaxis protein
MRRNTFAFMPSKPSENVPTANPPEAVAPVASGAGGSEGGPAPAGTMAWRLQQAFGNNKMMPTGVGSQRPIVLVADDDKRIRMVFRLRLEEAGMTVVEYDNGLSAWERLQKNDVAAAVLDMKMPGLHGLEVLSHMIDHNLSTPVVVCSAYDQLQDEFVVKTYPHLRYLVKPVAPDQLVSAIRELLTPKSP